MITDISKKARKLKQMITAAGSIAIIGHVRPDGDCIGSTTGLYNYITENFKNKTVDVYAESFASSFRFLNGAKKIKHESDGTNYDLAISVDVSSLDRLGKFEDIFQNAISNICIDHHVSSDGDFAEFNKIEPDASSTCEVIYRLLDKDKIDRDIATCLYTGIIHDTGVFKYESTSPETMMIAADLMSHGFDFTKIIDDGFYARYSDDIIFFTESEEKRDQEMEYINKVLSENKLTLNPDKIAFIKPGESFEFLGFLFDNGEVDVAHSSFDKIKKKLRRKARAVLRWKLKKDAEPEKAARVYIKYFNRKFFENPIKSELTWCRWYFPIITTDVTIKEIDHYMQECIRYIYTGKHSKRNFNLRYDDIKQLGYRSLVNEYHRKN